MSRNRRLLIFLNPLKMRKLSLAHSPLKNSLQAEFCPLSIVCQHNIKKIEKPSTFECLLEEEMRGPSVEKRPAWKQDKGGPKLCGSLPYGSWSWVCNSGFLQPRQTKE